MVIIKDTLDFKIIENTVVTIGKYDGVHNGHKLILDTMAEYRALGMKTCVLTFTEPPASLGFGKDETVIHKMNEKEQVFRRWGLDYLVEFPFNEETAAIGAKDFIDEFIVKRMNAKAVVVGEDCSFGHKAMGNAQMLVDYGPIYNYEIKVLNKLKDGDREISSTYIRELISSGKVEKANELMYRPYFVNGSFERALTGGTEGLLMYKMNIPAGKVVPVDGMFYSDIIYDEAFYPGISYVDTENRILETYVYGAVKGIAKNAVSVALWTNIDGSEDMCGLTTNDVRLREIIFEGQKWHKEHPRW